jgi:hypothetical protein
LIFFWASSIRFFDGVIHRGDQVLDVSAVERRNEAPAYRYQYLSSYVIGFVLERMNALAIHGHIIAAPQNALQFLRALRDNGSMAREQLEKALFSREKGSKPVQHGKHHLLAKLAPLSHSCHKTLRPQMARLMTWQPL